MVEIGAKKCERRWRDVEPKGGLKKLSVSKCVDLREWQDISGKLLSVFELSFGENVERMKGWMQNPF